MRLFVIIPAYNEAASISAVIKEIPRQIANFTAVKVLVINDGSTDETTNIAKISGADFVIENSRNIGLAKTFQNGIEDALRAGADIIVNTDADNQYNQTEIPLLIAPIIAHQADIVIGDRQIKKLKFMPWGNKYGNLLGSYILRLLTKTNVTDASSGFRAFSREAALKMNINFNHTYTHETIIQAAYQDLKIANVAIEFRPRLNGESKLIQNLFKHIKNSSLIILRTILLYKALKTFCYLGLIVMTPGIILGLRFIYYFFNTQGTGKIQSLILAAILIIIGFFIIVLGLIADLISTNRKINEQLLYYYKKQNWS